MYTIIIQTYKKLLPVKNGRGDAPEAAVYINNPSCFRCCLLEKGG